MMEVMVKGGTISEEEKQAYVDYVRNKYPGKQLKALTITLVDNEEVELYSEFSSEPFNRIRRITGYLVGTLDRFNDGKRAEEHDRVKHDRVKHDVRSE